MSSKRKSTRRQLSAVSYEALESRAMLAPVIAFEPLLGTLDITLTSDNDSATVGINRKGDVTVNGSNDINTAMLGVQTANFQDISMMDIRGNDLRTKQSVKLTGDFSNSIGGSIENIFVNSVGRLELAGSFDLSDDFVVTLNDSGGGVIQSSGRILVDGQTSINSGANPIELGRQDNDFVGMVSLEAGEHDVVIADANHILFQKIAVGQSFKVNAGGTISDTVFATIKIGEEGMFHADEISLGDSVSDSLTMFRTQFKINNYAKFFFDDVAILVGNSSAGSLHVESTHGIYDGKTSSIIVDGKASFVATNMIRIGEHGSDKFNSGELSFQAGAHASISANSDMFIVGDNFARSADLYSEGALTDHEAARINVTNILGLEGTKIVLGDADSDEFNAGSINFYSHDDLFISEDSNTHVIGVKNFAVNLTLQSTGHISDAIDARMTVSDVARFEANSLVVGESFRDRFNAGSISYDTNGRFSLHEDSSTNIVGNNFAGSTRIDSTSNLTNSEDATIISKMVADLSAYKSINLGFQSGDQVEFGSMILNSKGSVAVSENGDSILTGDSKADSLQLIATESILDSSEAKLNVNRVASFRAPIGITIGDQVNDKFNAMSLVVKSEGHVRVTQDSDMFLAGNNFAKSLSLEADGNIFDSNDVEIQVEHLLKLTGNIINIGTSDFDNVNTGSLSIQSSSNANIAVNSDVTFAGQNRVGNTLLLKSDGDIRDSDDSELMVERSAVFTAIDVIIGDTDTDCFELNLGDVFANVTGIKDITRGC